MDLINHQATISRDLVSKFSTSANEVNDFTLSALIKLEEDDTSRWSGEITFQKSFSQKDMKDNVLTPMRQTTKMVLLYAMQTGDRVSRFAFGITNVRKVTDSLILR